ncbi:dna-directed rna polymerases i ii and iii subunit rpabc2 [Holotrichia oblita]|uniref:Dna-directed rna polymerases i ii and iii subunit rpabc2 n=1 Tax=Holotrichia oblita TaxID=644536 RepID=A0ACB9T825_HOLOL|nr:dna-directed rna polymerases i ii and iii subunit rpabc2 [Holotrichia oblita]
MYSLFLEYCEENNVTEVATQSMYREIFNTEYNFSFFVPKKDLCDICNKYDTADVQQKQPLQEDYDTYILDKNGSRDAKNFDKERATRDSKFCAAVFDLPQIFPVPKSEEIKIAYATCGMKFSQNEVHLKLGAVWVILYTTMSRREWLNFPSTPIIVVAKIVINIFFKCIIIWQKKYNIIIRHTYLERGHTQNEGDSVHSTIENAARHIPIYLPHQWYTLVRTARKKHPYIVKEISQENIFDLKVLQMQTTMNWDKDEENEKVRWLNIKSIECNSKFPNILFCKYKYGCTEPFKKINLIEKGRKKINAMNARNSDCLKILYRRPIPLTKKKYDHLQFLRNKLVIASQYHEYFKNLPYTNNNNNNTRESDSDSE